MLQKTDLSLHYDKVYGRLLIVIGLLFTMIFLLGFFIADMWDSLFYCVFTIIMIYAGIKVQKHPYATYDEQSISLYHFNGSLRERHEYESMQAVSIRNNRFYVNGEKLKMNHWFIRKSDWKRMVAYFSDNSSSIFAELKSDEDR